MTPQKMRRLVVETAIPLSFNWVARDLNGSVHAYEKKPNLDYGTNLNPVACDMWDVYEGEVLQITPPTPVNAGQLSEEFGDWRSSLIEINEVISSDMNDDN